MRSAGGLDDDDADAGGIKAVRRVQRVRTICACRQSQREPRVPMRKVAVFLGDCAIGPRNATRIRIFLPRDAS